MDFEAAKPKMPTPPVRQRWLNQFRTLVAPLLNFPMFTKLRGELSAGTPGNDAEKLFRDERLRARDNAIASACMPIAFAYLVASLLITDQIVVSSDDQSLFRLAHWICISLHLLWYLKLRHIKLDLRYYSWCILFGYTAFIGYVLHRTIERGEADMVLSATGMTIFTVAFLLMCPFHNWMLALTGCLIAAISIGGVVDGPTWGPAWICINVMVAACFTLFQYVSAFRAGKLAIAEYRTLRWVAPAQVVRRALSAKVSLDKLFKPAVRPVACICTDWRDFQRFSRTKDPEIVAQTLDAYYDLCEKILSEVCPLGNYYSDWIADELFIVIFGRPVGSTKDLAQQALDFSRRLVMAKPKFLETHPMPQAIDLGISIGPALVGMMGPANHRKATALGEFPGIARRLQGTGKLLRHRLGDVDRIILHEFILSCLPGEPGIKVMKLEPGERLRDLDADAIFYLEPDPSAVSVSTLSDDTKEQIVDLRRPA